MKNLHAKLIPAFYIIASLLLLLDIISTFSFGVCVGCEDITDIMQTVLSIVRYGWILFLLLAIIGTISKRITRRRAKSENGKVQEANEKEEAN